MAALTTGPSLLVEGLVEYSTVLAASTVVIILVGSGRWAVQYFQAFLSLSVLYADVNRSASSHRVMAVSVDG